MRNQIVLNNRPVVIESVAGGCLEDAYIESAYFDDSLTDEYSYLTAGELDSVAAMYPEAVADRWYQDMIGRAEALADCKGER